MAQSKTKKFIAILIGIIVVTGIALTVAFASDSSKGNTEEDAIIGCTKQAETIETNVGAIPTDTVINNLKNNTATMLTEEQAQQIMDTYDKQLSTIFSENRAPLWMTHEKNIVSRFTQYSFDELPVFDVQIDAVCLSYEIKSIKIDGETASVEGNAISWTKYIERKDESHRYTVILGFAKDQRSDTLILSNGNWLIDTENGDVEFAPDSYHSDKGTCDTFEEAVAAAAKLDPAAENPFK